MIYKPLVYFARVYHSQQVAPTAGRVPPCFAPGFGLPRHDGLGTGGLGEDAMERHGLAVPRRRVLPEPWNWENLTYLWEYLRSKLAIGS